MDSKAVQIIVWINNIKYHLNIIYNIMYMLSTQVITLCSQVGNLIY